MDFENKYNKVLLQGRLRQKKYYSKNRDTILARKKLQRQQDIEFIKSEINDMLRRQQLLENLVTNYQEEEIKDENLANESYHIKETEEERDRQSYNGIRSRFCG